MANKKKIILSKIQINEGCFNIFDVLFCLFITGISTFIILNGKIYSQLAGDTGDGYFAIISGITRSIVSKELPLWSPNLWGGYYAPAFPFTGVFYPITILINVLCYDTATNMLSYKALPINLIVHTVIMTVSLYALFRILRLKQITCTIAAVFAMSPGYFEGLWHAFFLSTSWLPCIILFSVLSFRERTGKAYLYCIVAGFSFGLSGLAMSGQTLLINILIFIFLLLSFTWKNRSNGKSVVALYIKTAVIGFLGFSICSVSLLPFIEFYKSALRFVPDYGWLTSGQKIKFPDFIKHNAIISNLGGIIGFQGGWFQIGIATSVFLWCSFFRKMANNQVIYHFALFTFIFCLCYSIGVIFPDFIFYIPFLNAIREPYLYARYACISATILAALGLDPFLKNHKKNPISNRFHCMFGLQCIVAGLLLFSLLPHNRNPFNVLVVVTLVLFFVLFIPERVSKLRIVFAPLVLMTLIFSSLYNFWNSLNDFKYSASTALSKIASVDTQTKKMISYLNEKNGHPYFRIMRYGNVMPSNSAAVLNAYDAFGYLNPMYTKSVKMHSMDLTNRAKLQNVKYALVGSVMDDKFRNWFKSSYPEFLEINTIDNYADYHAEEMTTVTIYENTNYIGPAWLVHDFQTYDPADEFEKIYETIKNSSKDLTNTIFINSATLTKNLTNEQMAAQHTKNNTSSGNVGTNINILSYKANSIFYEVNTASQGILVSSECYYPGWRVYVNGKREQLMEANYWGRAVVVPEGHSTVEFKFVPLSFIIGCVLFFISIFSSILYILYYFKRQKD